MKVVPLLIWAAGGALCAGMSLALFHVDQPDAIQNKGVIVFTANFVAITIGVLVWQRRPDNRTGILLTAIPFASVLPEAQWIFWNHTLAVTFAFATTQLAAPLVGHLMLAYPTGRLTSRVDRVFVAFAYGWAFLYALPLLLFFDPQYPHGRYWLECGDCAVPVTHIAWHNVGGIRNTFDWIFLPLVVIFLGLLIRKLWRASPGARRIVLPLWIAVFFLGVQFLVQMAVYGSPVNSWTSSRWFWIVTLASLAIPVSLGLGLLWGRSARSAVADLVVELERTPPGRVREALARTLGDPSLQVALWSPQRGSYVDTQGRKLDLPSPTADRAVTVLGPVGLPVAALVHDPVLLERRGLLEAAGAAARLALENERLQAELRAQLAELRASRTRIVQAGDDERRRLERNLHDGAQQRLLGLGLALQLARAQIGAAANGASELLAEAEDELRTALDELRELARGIHPAILTDQGLGAALRSLAERSTVPVRIADVPNERLGESVEAATYFLVSESLANCAKYARASAVSVSVTRRDGNAVVHVKDNGVGGADATHGSGLRGLADRIQALDGRFEVESPIGGGTHIHAEIPCAS
jgi:signal transduction histidine kinase